MWEEVKFSIQFLAPCSSWQHSLFKLLLGKSWQLYRFLAGASKLSLPYASTCASTNFCGSVFRVRRDVNAASIIQPSRTDVNAGCALLLQLVGVSSYKIWTACSISNPNGMPRLITALLVLHYLNGLVQFMPYDICNFRLIPSCYYFRVFFT